MSSNMQPTCWSYNRPGISSVSGIFVDNSLPHAHHLQLSVLLGKKLKMNPKPEVLINFALHEFVDVLKFFNMEIAIFLLLLLE
jgi:hypothetical protein